MSDKLYLSLSEQEEEAEIFLYLDRLRESGVTNMMGAGHYLQDKFNMNRQVAGTFLVKWRETFSERHPNG